MVIFRNVEHNTLICLLTKKNMLCYKDCLKDDPSKCFAFFWEVCLRQANEALLLPIILYMYTSKITLLFFFFFLFSFSILSNNLIDNYKTNKSALFC